MIALLTACLFFEILVHVQNASAKARAKTVFGHLKWRYYRHSQSQPRSQALSSLPPLVQTSFYASINVNPEGWRDPEHMWGI